MIHFDAEFLLAVGILAFYLFDSASLLHFDDLLIVGGRRGWRASTGASLEMRGRFLHVPPPLLPFRTEFHASWLSVREGAQDTADTLQLFSRQLRWIRVGCVLAGACMLVAIPSLLLTTRDPIWLLCALAGTWLSTLSMLGLLLARRHALQLDGRKLAALAIESLLCPPCAPNLYRKLCRWRGFRGDPIAFARDHTAPAEQPRLREAIDARIAMFALADEDSGGSVAGIRAAQSRIHGVLP